MDCKKHGEDVTVDTCSLCDEEFCVACVEMDWCERCKIVFCEDCSSPEAHPTKDHNRPGASK